MISSLVRGWFTRADKSPSAHEQPEAPISDAETQFRAGLSMACATGESQDYAQAAQCYAQAAAQNHPLAQFNLAVMYAQGQGVTRDYIKSSMWMKRAAELGDAGAQYRFGMQEYLAFRKAGLSGVTDTRIEALKWIRLSAAQGYRGAQDACEFVAIGMTPGDVAEGGRRAGAFDAERMSGATHLPA